MNNKILRYQQSGGFVDEFATGTGTDPFGLNGPNGLLFDGGSLYVTTEGSVPVNGEPTFPDGFPSLLIRYDVATRQSSILAQPSDPDPSNPPSLDSVRLGPGGNLYLHLPGDEDQCRTEEEQRRTQNNGMAPSLRSDVLVIGGGPAGTAAAITCASAGLAVSLVESRAFPRHRPGETLHPGIEPLLERLGAAEAVRSAGFLRHPGVWVYQSGSSQFQPYGEDSRGPWLGFQAPRAEFDSLLLAVARSRGVAVHQPHRSLCVITENGRVAGAKTTAGTIRAAFTVDASGSPSWLAQQLALPLTCTSRRLTALYGYLRGECPVLDDAPRFEYLSDGWLWMARVQPGLYHWTRLFTTNPRPYREWSPPEFAALQPAARVCGADVTWAMVERTAGPGYFIVGDAAALMDPSTSKGVLHAVMSGMLAGHHIVQGLRTNAPESHLSVHYSNFIQEWFRFNVSRTSELFPLAGQREPSTSS